jgi:hypothetical protein
MEVKIIYRKLAELEAKIRNLKTNRFLAPLIEAIPTKHLLRFSGKGRTILIIKRGKYELLLIDTFREKFNRERVKCCNTTWWFESIFYGNQADKVIEFLNDPETQIELVDISHISREEARKKSTFAKYL